MTQRDTSKSDRRAQVEALPRPKRLADDTDLRAEVAQIRETDDLFRVYLPEWLVVYTSEAVGHEGTAEAEAYYAENYAGRVHDEDWLVYSHGPTWAAQLRLRLPNVRGEYKHRSDAEKLAAEVGQGSVVVVRNSAEEYRLKDYSVKKLLA